ncbi:MAG: TMEM175 family protein [Candidatus Baltobacteraceae bacterium]
MSPAHEERRAHFTRRLEAFCDIVFGLSLSQLAFQLGVPTRVEQLVADPLRYLVFFGSFAIICVLWLGHHQMFRHFAAGRLDVFLNFVYLAFVALIPFAMNVYLHFAYSRIGLGIYALCFVGTTAPMTVLRVLGLRRDAADMEAGERLTVYRGVIRGLFVAVAMLLALASLGLGAAFAPLPMLLIIPAMIVIRRKIRAVPAWILGHPEVPSTG